MQDYKILKMLIELTTLLGNHCSDDWIKDVKKIISFFLKANNSDDKKKEYENLIIEEISNLSMVIEYQMFKNDIDYMHKYNTVELAYDIKGKFICGLNELAKQINGIEGRSINYNYSYYYNAEERYLEINALSKYGTIFNLLKGIMNYLCIGSNDDYVKPLLNAAIYGEPMGFKLLSYIYKELKDKENEDKYLNYYNELVSKNSNDSFINNIIIFNNYNYGVLVDESFYDYLINDSSTIDLINYSNFKWKEKVGKKPIGFKL